MHHGDDLTENSEINVVPFIDIVLVLLIVFMVAAPLATVNVNVDLPSSTAEPKPDPKEPIYLSIKADSSLYLDSKQISRQQLGTKLDKMIGNKKDHPRIYLRADKSVAYGTLMKTLNKLQSSGYLKVSLVGLDKPPE